MRLIGHLEEYRSRSLARANEARLSNRPAESVTTQNAYGQTFASMRGSHGQLLRTIVLVCLTASSAVTQTTPYPKPQVPSAVAQLAPDFRLKNQDGKVFHLAALRGHWVLLFFYRGYW